MTTALLSIQHVTKEYHRGFRANDDVSVEVAAGEVVGLLGHNGAGKTTLLNQVMGLARPTSGSIMLAGRDVVGSPAVARRLCSLQPQGQVPLEGVTPRQAVQMMARIRGADRKAAVGRATELIEALDIGEWADQSGSKLSGGVRRLTAFAMAAARPGRLVMLDEPTNDVDPVRRRLLWQQVRALADAGSAVVLVTHNVIEAERAVDQLVVMDRGTVVGRGTPAELRGDQAGQLRLELHAADEPSAAVLAESLATQAFCARQPVSTGRRVSVPVADVAAAIAWTQATGGFEEFTLTPVSLEDVYIRLVSEDGTGERAGHAELVA